MDLEKINLDKQQETYFTVIINNLCSDITKDIIILYHKQFTKKGYLSYIF